MELTYEEKFERYRKLGLQLGLMVPKTVLRIRLDNPDGTVIERRGLSRSWTRNAYVWMFSQLGAANARDATFGNGLTSFKQIDASIRWGYANVISGPGSATGGGYNGSIGAEFGIVVGTGTGAESFEDYVLGAIIHHGEEPGEFSYNLGTYLKTWTGGSLEMQNSFERIFNNNSGGTITVGEIGIYALVSNGAMYGQTYLLVIRDLVDPTIDVVDAAQLTVTYDIILTYPE